MRRMPSRRPVEYIAGACTCWAALGTKPSSWLRTSVCSTLRPWRTLATTAMPSWLPRVGKASVIGSPVQPNDW